MMRTSVIVPAYNEEQNIGNVLSVITRTACIQEIICIDDGSTDRTRNVISSFPAVDLISLRTNNGKAGAVTYGLGRATGDIVVLVDADLVGFEKHHLHELIQPLKRKKADAVIGYRDIPTNFIFGPLSGERAYFRRDLLPYLHELRKKGYGLELFLNYIYATRQVKIVNLKGVRDVIKYKKQPYAVATEKVIDELRDIAREVAVHENPPEFFMNAYLSKYFINDSEWRSSYHKLRNFFTRQ